MKKKFLNLNHKQKVEFKTRNKIIVWVKWWDNLEKSSSKLNNLHEAGKYVICTSTPYVTIKQERHCWFGRL